MRRHERESSWSLWTACLMVISVAVSPSPAFGGPGDVRIRSGSLHGQTSVAWTLRFEGLLKDYSRRPSSRAETLRKLTEILDETLRLAGESSAASRRICDFYDRHARFLEKQKSLNAKLEEHYRLHFEKAIENASSPYALRDLSRWCHDRGFKEGEGRVARILKKINPLTARSSFARSRIVARKRREVTREAVREFMDQRCQEAAEQLRATLAWMEKERFAPPRIRNELKELVRRIVGEQADAHDLLRDIDGLDHVELSPSKEKKLTKTFCARKSRMSKRICGKISTAVEKCFAAGEPGLAFDLLQLFLRVEPDDRRARRALGQVSVEGRWLRLYEARRLRAGWVWDDDRAWIFAKGKERYERGEYYDPGARKWGTLARWNKLHSNVEHPWRLESEHFELISTADLGLSARVLRRLESFFFQVFRQYDRFFMNQGPSRRTRLIFGIAPVAKRLKVYFYRSPEQFREHASLPTEWAGGFYDPSRRASFFYASGQEVPERKLQHELVHQILGEFSQGRAPSWLAEAAAVYLEDASLEDGRLELGGLSDHCRVEQYRRRLAEGEAEHSFTKMLSFRTCREWDSGDIAKNYRGAGAVAYFLMHMDDGGYRGDFLDMLRDAYNGNLRSPESYFAISTEGLDYLMERFYKAAP